MLKKSRGQTLIESLVALTVLVIGVMGAVSLAIYTVRAAETSQEDIVAANLAQEGIEGLRWLRDFNWKNGVAWDEGLSTRSGGFNILGRMVVHDAEAEFPFEFQDRDDGPYTEGFIKLCIDEKTGRYVHLDRALTTCKEGGYVDSGYSRVVYTWNSDEDSFYAGALVEKSGRQYFLTEELLDWW